MTTTLRGDGSRPRLEVNSLADETAATRAAGGMAYLVLDFTFVTTIDSTALAALVKVIGNWAEERSPYTSLRAARRTLEGFVPSHDERFRN